LAYLRELPFDEALGERHDSLAVRLHQLRSGFLGEHQDIAVDRRRGASSRRLELLGHVGPEHLDLEAAIELSDVANLDALPEHRLAIAFYGSLGRSHVQEIDEIGVSSLTLSHEVGVVAHLIDDVGM